MADSPRFTHIDETKWQEVRRQQHGDRTVSIREKWLDFSPGFLSLYAKWDPGMIVQPHGHNSNHVVFVLEGEMSCGDMHCPKGTHIALDQGDTFGPFVAGPDGVELFEVMMGDPARSRPTPKATTGSSPSATCSRSPTRRSTCRPGSRTRVTRSRGPISRARLVQPGRVLSRTWAGVNATNRAMPASTIRPVGRPNAPDTVPTIGGPATIPR